MDLWIIWLIVAIVLLIVEIVSVNLLTIWFSIAAFIMSPLSLLNMPIPVQIIIFVLISVVLMILLKKMYDNKIRPKNVLKDNLTDKMINQVAMVTKTINNDKNEGQVIIGDIYWRAESLNNDIIEQGTKVSIVKIENMLVYVQKI